MSTSIPEMTLEARLQAARTLLEQGQNEQAVHAYEALLQSDPDSIEALNVLGMHALGAKEHARAIELFERALALEPASAQAASNLGLAHLTAEQPEPARDLFARALQLAPKSFIGRLHYAHALELLGNKHAALVNYFRAITDAQTKGRWLNERTTAPVLRELVKHAIRFVGTGRKRLFDAVLEPLRERHGADALRRTEHCLSLYLGEQQTSYPDPRQKPKFLYFPDLPPTTYFDRELFPWYTLLESNFDVIRAELRSVLSASDSLEPFLGQAPPEALAEYLGGVENPVWNAFFFYRHGERYDANCARCPKTSAILDQLPIVRVRDHAPEVCFSVLTPGTHILKHQGVTNTRLVTHMPLIVPENCAINVGGEEKVWQEGECFSFDDTFEHEAWNRGKSTRVVMLLDAWNPYLSPVECEAVTGLVEAIGDFNAECEIAMER